MRPSSERTRSRTHRDLARLSWHMARNAAVHERSGSTSDTPSRHRREHHDLLGRQREGQPGE